MEKSYPHLFLPLQVGPAVFKNRIVGLPVYTGYAYPDGQVSQLMIEHYSGLAQSGAAMIVVANAAVAENGTLSRYNLRADRDEFIPGLTRLAAAIKSAGAIACLQLNHAGKFARSAEPRMPSALDASNVAFNINSLKHFMEFFPLEKRFGLTQNFLKMAANWIKGMTDEEKEEIMQAYAKAAVRAMEAGFQAVELHGAGGYLICQFLSGFTNRKTDGTPKPFSERIRFPLQLIKETKRQLPKEVLLGYRIILDEWVPDGIHLEESLKWARLLEKEGISYFSASAGTYNSMFEPTVRRRMQKTAYLVEPIKCLTTSVHVPVIAAGRIIRPEIAENLIQTGVSDLIGLGRPLRTDSHWIKKSLNSPESIKTCVNCNWCLRRVVLDRGFNCRRWKAVAQEKIDLEHRLLYLNFRALWVISDKNDIRIYQRTLNKFLPATPAVKNVLRPAAVFLNTSEDYPSLKEINDFSQWADRSLREKEFQHAHVKWDAPDPDTAPDKWIASEVTEKEYGIIFTCRNKDEAWRDRLPYRLRGKFIGLLGTAPRQEKVLVPVDMSVTTALILSFIRQTYGSSQIPEFHFMYVLEQNDQQAQRRWERLTKAAGYDAPPPLEVIHPSDDVPGTILKRMKQGRFGSIFMGKRSMSKVKRRLLGTTSAAVLHGTKDESVFIIE